MPEIAEQPVAVVADAPLEKEDPTAGNEHIVAGPKPLAEVESLSEKALAKIVKEGGKRGVEIEGAADMGGLQFFCTMMGDLTKGKVGYLLESMKAMNAISTPGGEEGKGGAGKLGKIIFSFTEGSLSAVAYVPKDKAVECPAKDWLHSVVCDIASKKVADEKILTFEAEGIDAAHYAAVQIDSNPGENLFPIKMRDPAISMAYNFLKKKGLFPEDDDEDDDEYVFGDEDFP